MKTGLTVYVCIRGFCYRLGAGEGATSSTNLDHDGVVFQLNGELKLRSPSLGCGSDRRRPAHNMYE
jgi:hypothetical protein